MAFIIRIINKFKRKRSIFAVLTITQYFRLQIMDDSSSMTIKWWLVQRKQEGHCTKIQKYCTVQCMRQSWRNTLGVGDDDDDDNNNNNATSLDYKIHTAKKRILYSRKYGRTQGSFLQSAIPSLHKLKLCLLCWFEFWKITEWVHKTKVWWEIQILSFNHSHFWIHI